MDFSGIPNSKIIATVVRFEATKVCWDMTWWKQFLEGCMIPGFWNRVAESTLQVGFLLRHHQTPRQSPTSLQAPKAENFPSELSGLSESSSNLLGSDGGVTWRWDFWLNKALTCDTGFSEFIWCQYVTCNYSVHIRIFKRMYMWYVCMYIYAQVCLHMYSPHTFWIYLHISDQDNDVSFNKCYSCCPQGIGWRTVDCSKYRSKHFFKTTMYIHIYIYCWGDMHGSCVRRSCLMQTSMCISSWLTKDSVQDNVFQQAGVSAG